MDAIKKQIAINSIHINIGIFILFISETLYFVFFVNKTIPIKKNEPTSIVTVYAIEDGNNDPLQIVSIIAVNKAATVFCLFSYNILFIYYSPTTHFIVLLSLPFHINYIVLFLLLSN